MATNRSVKLLLNEIKNILKVYWKQLLIISILMWFLLYILNFFLSLSLYAGHFSDTMRDKLGMYFYINDTVWNEQVIYKEIMDLKDSLEKKWLEVVFSSKKDAFQFLESRVPDVAKSFKKYGIENPLPATLYVMFHNEQEYQVLRENIIQHKNIILNIKDINNGTSLKQQENRVLSIINFTNLFKRIAYVLMGVLWLIFLFFLTFMLENIFQRFRHDLSVKKLLWATHRQVLKSFMWITMKVVSASVVITLILVLLSMFTVNHYLIELFDVSMFVYIHEHMAMFLVVIAVELLSLFAVSFGVSYWFIKSLNKKI